MTFRLYYSIVYYSNRGGTMATLNNVDKMLKNWGKEYKKGFMGYFILLFLKERSMYGFEINKQLVEMTQAKMTFQESGIYQILKNLQENGMVSTEWKESSKGPRRKYYKIEEAGQQLLELFTKDYILPIINTSFKLVKKHFPGLK